MTAQQTKSRGVKRTAMHESRVIEINGQFVAAALAEAALGGWRLVAADPRLLAIDGKVAASFEEARSMAHQSFFSPEPAVSRQLAA